MVKTFCLGADFFFCCKDEGATCVPSLTVTKLHRAVSLKPGLHVLSFTENRRERIFAANIDEKPLIWFTLTSIRQENVKKM